jgi:CheY-like chemotaxis protein
MTDQPLFVYVEDEPLSRMVMQMLMVKSLGYQDVVILEDSSQFLESLEALNRMPSVIFLDIHVKPYNGFQMLEMLRQHKHFHQVRVIALTASVMNEEVDLLKTAGFDGGIAKPIDAAMFPQTLNAILNGEEIWQIA